MTFSAACGWSLLRSTIVALVGLWGAVHLARLFPQQRLLPRAVAWGLVLLPFLAPGLIVGYGYRNYSLSLVHYPAWNEVLYAAILIAQATPVGVLLLRFAPPPPLSASAVHCVRLMEQGCASTTIGDRIRRFARLLAAECRGPRQNRVAVAAVMFLIAFQESETAALMQAHGWAERLFTRYAGVVDLATTRQELLVLVAIQAVVVVPVLLWLWRNLSIERQAETDPLVPVHPLWWLWPIAACLLTVIVPAAVVFRGTWSGLAALGQQPSFWQELTHGMVFAAASGTVAVTAAGAMLHRIGRNGANSSSPSGSARLRTVLGGLLLLPGFCGSMTLALLVDDLFQQPWLLWAYDTPARILTAQTLVLLPRAVLIQTCIPFDRLTAGIQTAALLQTGTHAQRQAARDLLWSLRGSRRFWSFVLVCSWAYLDLMIATISAPPGMEPVVKRLYNFMHFGHIAGLSAMVCVTVAAPLLLVAAALTARRCWSRWNPA